MDYENPQLNRYDLHAFKSFIVSVRTLNVSVNAFTIKSVVIFSASLDARSIRMVAEAPGIPTAGIVII